MNFTYLVMKGHPYGREMLRVLKESGVPPSCIIQENSPIARFERNKFLKRIEGEGVPPRIADITADIPVYSVSDHNSQECLEFVLAQESDWIILGGTRIIKGALLEWNMLNVHPGLLPWVRGSSPEAWSIFYDLPVGVTCHKVDRGVDTGPILLRRALIIQKTDTYGSIVRRNITLAAHVMVEAIELITAGKAHFQPQDQRHKRAFRVMPEESLNHVRQKLEFGSYHPRDLEI